MANYLKRPNGTEDVTPERIHKWNTVEKVTREIAESFGFSEIRIPTFEQTELFQRSVGETTDVVQKEMYSVIAKETKFTLRPEGTAGTIRAMLQNGMLADALPQKVFYQLSCFRHERPQAGRLREFHQFGVEMAGAASPYADAEVILLGKTVLDRLGLKDIVLNINSIGCPKCRAKYQEALKAYFTPHKDQLCETCQERLVRNPMRLLDCKSPEDQAIAKDAPVILDYLCEECNAHFDAVKSALTDMGVEPYLVASALKGVFSQRLVRRICPNCKKAYEPSEEEQTELGLIPKEGRTFYRGTGCPVCFDTGYRGRTAVFEIFPLTIKVRRMIAAHASREEIETLLKDPQSGFVSLRENAIRLVEQGVITSDEVLRVIYEDI